MVDVALDKRGGRRRGSHLMKSGPIVVALLALGLAACDASSASVTTTTEQPAAASTTERQTSTTAAAATLTAARIVDGDTFEGSDGITYRLAAIDAPETGTELGPAATQRLAELLDGPLTIEVGEVATIDRYGRTLAYAFAGNTFVNETLVREGLAGEAFYGDNIRYRDRYLAARPRRRPKGSGCGTSHRPHPRRRPRHRPRPRRRRPRHRRRLRPRPSRPRRPRTARPATTRASRRRRIDLPRRLGQRAGVHRSGAGHRIGPLRPRCRRRRPGFE